MLSGLIIALSFLFVLQSAAQMIESEENSLVQGPITLEVSYGYGDVAKGGRYVPMTITMENHEEASFTGNIIVSTMESDYRVYSYEFPVEIDGMDTLSQSCIIPFGQGSDQIFVTLSDKNGVKAARKRLKMNVSKEIPELFIGVLSDSPESLNYLDGVGINYSAVRTRVIPLKKEDFPVETIGLNMMDVLLVSNYRLRDLSEKQTKAIMDWVKDGGILILGTGERVDDTLGRFAPELLDDNYGTPAVMNVHLGTEDEDETVLVQGLLCVDIPLHGATVLDSEAGFPLFQAAALEKGVVAVAAYDFTEISDFASQEPTYVDEMFTNLLGEERIQSLTDYFYGGSSEEYWAIQNVINSGNVSRLPKVSVYFMVIIVYILLIGPGAYLFLRRRELRNYYWGAVTMLSLIFMAVIYLLGMQTRFKTTFLTYATIQDSSTDTVIETSYINVRNPYNKPYALELAPNYSIRPISRNAVYDYSTIPKFMETNQPKVTISHNPSATRLTFHDSVAFDSNYLQLRKADDNVNQGGIAGEIEYFDGEITGMVTNQYDFMLEDCAVLMYGELILLGDMEPGETKDLAAIPSYHSPVGKEQFIAARVTGLDAYDKADINDKEYVRDMERANLLAFYMRSELEGYRREARVVGFARKMERQFMSDQKVEAYGLDMFTSAVTVYNDTSDGEIYRSALMKAPKVQKGSYDYTRNSMYGVDAVTLEYSIGNDIDVEEITFFQVSEELIKNKLMGRISLFNGDMYFYNYNTGIYDRMERDKRIFTVDELHPYLSPGNTMTIKYIDDRQEESGWDAVLPMPMVKGREK